MQKTTNADLNLPEPTDKFDVEHFNENFRKIDEFLPRAVVRQSADNAIVAAVPSPTIGTHETV